MLKLIVRFEMKEGCREAFFRKVSEEGILAKVRAENGCHYYDLYDSKQDPDLLLLLEEWENMECQQAHIATDHMARFREIKKDYVNNTVIQAYELVEFNA